MYRGYKKRNQELDRLAQVLPPFLANTKTSLVVQDFQDVKDEGTVQELHKYLFSKYILLDRVIKARKLHHSHFYAIDMDYGHEKYLTKLLNDKHVIARALERLGQRGAEIVHQKKQWLNWIKTRQEEEESQRENESKKVKLEALLLKRHQKELRHHQLAVAAKENKQREEEYLNGAFEQRLSEMTEEEQDDWDPVLDVFGYERANYVDLIKFFLMLQDHKASDDSDDGLPSLASLNVSGHDQEKPLSKSAKKRAKKANAEQKKLEDPTKQCSDDKGPNTIEMETKSQMRDRLRKPVNYERPPGLHAVSPGELTGRLAYTTPSIPDDELDTLLEEVAEVKHLLFCRLLLSHATLLPIALRSDSIEAFLADEDVTREHLRDICLKLERPGLQDVRDACADFVRGKDGEVDEPDTDRSEDEEEDEDESVQKRKIPDKYALKFRNKNRLPEKYQTKREKAKKKAKAKKNMLGRNEQEAIVEFDDDVDESRYERKRIRIKVCGRYMYNYPSEKALGRGGWYHFSVIAKDSSLFDAISLCRNWNEFFELNILAIHLYFPARKWTNFVGDLLRQQLVQLGFIPYFVSDHADKVTHYFQTGSRGMGTFAFNSYL